MYGRCGLRIRSIRSIRSICIISIRICIISSSHVRGRLLWVWQSPEPAALPAASESLLLHGERTADAVNRRFAHTQR